MAELADALDSGSSEVKLIQVQVLLSAPVRVFIWTLGLFIWQNVVMNIRTSREPRRASRVRGFCFITALRSRL